jgi:hypothetical protein
MEKDTEQEREKIENFFILYVTCVSLLKVVYSFYVVGELILKLL